MEKVQVGAMNDRYLLKYETVPLNSCITIIDSSCSMGGERLYGQNVAM